MKANRTTKKKPKRQPVTTTDSLQNKIRWLEQKVEKLRELVACQSDVIGWYDMELERGNYDDDDLDPDLIESEQAIEKAANELKELEQENL